MSNRPIKSVLVLAATILVMSGCDGDKGIAPEQNAPQQLRLTPLPDERAEWIALWLSREIEAPLELYERVHADLERIYRSGLPPEDGELRPFYFAQSVQSTLNLRFHPGGIETVRQGGSPTWDSLNTLYKPWFVWPTDEENWTSVHFPGRLNASLLGNVYRKVPEVKQIGHSSEFSVPHNGIRNLMVGRQEADTLTYMFVGIRDRDHATLGENDTFWCYYTVESGISYAGDFVWLDDPIPLWWPDFCSLVPLYSLIYGNYCYLAPDFSLVHPTDIPPSRLKKDPFTILSVELVGDTLSVNTSYPGGCRIHKFTTYMTPRSFEAGSPPIANLYLTHNANGDACEGEQTHRAQLLVTPVARYYALEHDQVVPILLRFWNYAQDDFIELLYEPDLSLAFETTISDTMD